MKISIRRRAKRRESKDSVAISATSVRVVEPVRVPPCTFFDRSCGMFE